MGGKNSCSALRCSYSGNAQDFPDMDQLISSQQTKLDHDVDPPSYSNFSRDEFNSEYGAGCNLSIEQIPNVFQDESIKTSILDIITQVENLKSGTDWSKRIQSSKVKDIENGLIVISNIYAQKLKGVQDDIYRRKLEYKITVESLLSRLDEKDEKLKQLRNEMMVMWNSTDLQKKKLALIYSNQIDSLKAMIQSLQNHEHPSIILQTLKELLERLKASTNIMSEDVDYTQMNIDGCGSTSNQSDSQTNDITSRRGLDRRKLSVEEKDGEITCLVTPSNKQITNASQVDCGSSASEEEIVAKYPHDNDELVFE